LSCHFCQATAVYGCNDCEKLVCAEHAKLRVVCLPCAKKNKSKYAIEEVTSEEERSRIRELVRGFWGEEEQLAFDKRFEVAGLSAYAAKADGETIGFVSFAEVADALIIVALGVLPQYQCSGVGRSLAEKVEAVARNLRKKRLLVSTSNDDLPALAFYQCLGFQIFEVKPNVIAEKHGKVVKGIGGLPVRDELRLQKILS
jgi:ribosomal protein S18 acetylase RimI-like enzyme